MNTKQLHDVLQEALLAFRPDTSDFTLFMSMHEASVGDPKANIHAVQLLTALRLIPALNIFNGTIMHVVPGTAQIIDYPTLAAWLLRRAMSVGVCQTLEDITTYIDSNELPFQITLVFSNIYPETLTDIGQYISFIRWTDLHKSWQQQQILEQLMIGSPSHCSLGALVREQRVERTFVTQDAFSHTTPDTDNSLQDDRDLRDALRCLALIGPYAPQILGSWASPPEWAPLNGGGMFTPESIDHFGLESSRMSAEECTQASYLFAAFLAAPPQLQSRLRLAEDRLVSAMRRRSTVDASIDLGISLEGLYLYDVHGELSFRLKARAARFLRTTEIERRRISRLVGNIYDIRSNAVHTGIVKPVYDGKPAQHILKEGFSLTAETVRRFITSGQPDWDTIMYS